MYCSSVDKQGLTELQNQCHEYKTVAQVAEVERDKLMDLMKVLQHRYNYSYCLHCLCRRSEQTVQTQIRVLLNKIDLDGAV